MKCESLFSGKKMREIIIILSAAEFTHRVVKVDNKVDAK